MLRNNGIIAILAQFGTFFYEKSHSVYKDWTDAEKESSQRGNKTHKKNSKNPLDSLENKWSRSLKTFTRKVGSLEA